MQGTCLKTEWCTWNYIFTLTLFTFDPFDPGEVAWILFGPKNTACSQNSLDSGRLLHLCSMVSMPCALDQAVVVHEPLHRRVSCFTVAFKRLSWILRTLYWIRCSGGWSLWRQISNNVGQHISTSMVECYSMSFRAGLRCRDEIVCPLIQCALQAMGPGATLFRTTVPLLTELGSSHISCRLLPRFGSCQFLDSE